MINTSLRISTLTLLFSFLCVSYQAQQISDDIFSDSLVHEIRIEFSEANYWSLLLNNYESHQDPMDPIPYIMANIELDGESIDSVGIRLKGFTSYFTITDKKPIKIDFNEFVSGQSFQGLRKLNLNNGTGDASYQRDVICYDLMRRNGVNAPRTSFTKLYLNDTYWGIYQIIEQVDRAFIQDHYDNSDGNLYKNLGWSHFEWLGNNPSQYQEVFSLKTNEEENDWSGFVNLMDVLNNTNDAEFEAEISKVFNVDLFLRTLAVDVATNNWDSYLEHGRNWYVYENDVTGVFQWIPWDYNFSMGGFLDFGGGDECNVFPDFISLPTGNNTIQFFDNSWGSEAGTFTWDFGDGQMSTDVSPTHVYDAPGEYFVCLDVFIDDTCSESFCKFVSSEENYNNCEVILNGSCPHPVGQNFAATLEINPSCCEFWSEDCDEIYASFSSFGLGFDFEIDQRGNGGVLINRLLNVPTFYERYLSYFCSMMEDAFTTDHYFDLLNTNKLLLDEYAQDDPNSLYPYGSFLQDIGPTGLQGFIESRIEVLKEELVDMDACQTYQTNIGVQSIVINEFVASNDSTSSIVDAELQTNDWIELFNNTNEDISLTGTFLSDNPENIQKWAFPIGSIIRANDYLIIWADEDKNQPGLHSNFKLSKNGEQIMLSNSDGSIIDEVNFTEQTTNIASARIPNGTGDFVQQGNTFGYNNDLPSSTQDVNDLIAIKLYPNPVQENLSIDLGPDYQDYTIQLYNIAGQLLHMDRSSPQQVVSIDISRYEAGQYYISINDEVKNIKTIDFIKM